MSDSQLQAGYAQVDISPPPGTPNMHGHRIEATLDPVYGRVLYLAEAGGEGPVLLAMADHWGFDAISDRRARAVMSAASGVPVERIRLNVSHNHTCPGADRAVQELLHEVGVEHVGLDWLDRVEPRLADAAARAVASRVPVTVEAAMAPVRGIAANRSIHRLDNTVLIRLGSGPEPLREAPVGLVDPDCTVVCFRGLAGRPVVTLVNYPCHPTSLATRGRLISPDFPGYAAEIVERETGGPMFFLQGCGGNVGTGKYADGSLEATRLLGRRLADSVLAAMGWLEPVAAGPLLLDHWREPVTLNPALPSAEALRRELREAAPGAAWAVAARLYAIEHYNAEPTVELFLLSLGDWALAGLPAESFVEAQLAIRAASPYRFTLVGGYYDCTLWYIPNWQHHRHGGYESRGGWDYTAPGSSERLTAAMIRRLT